VLRELDLRLLRLLRTRGHAQPWEALVVRYSRLGEHAFLWLLIAAVGALVDSRRRRLYLRAARAIVITNLINIVAKRFVRRTRPFLEDLPALSPTLSSLSYPSAHASTSFAAAHALSRTMPTVPLYVAASVMSLSRPYIGVHYPSDVAAGALLGTAVARLAE
jgi:membrane-associated phospholipid phosphatase